MKVRRLGRRQVLLQGFATLSATLMLKGCKSQTSSAKNPTNSDFEDQSLSLESYLQSISVPPANGKPPAGLVVCLHGFGGNAQQLAPFTPVLNLPDYQFLFPDAPYPHPRRAEGKMWYDLNSQDYRGLTESRQRLTDWLKALEGSTGIPLSRTILSGFSQGGAMTLDVGLTLPLAGLVSLSGYLHSNSQPTSGDSVPPVLIVHGRKDQVVPLSAAQRARDRLTALGVAVKYQEFNMGHEILPEVLALLRSFVVDVSPKT